MRQLLDLGTLITLDPFDRTRPLWQFTVVEGLRGGKAALVSKMHHTITDGEGGMQMSLQYLDFDRDAPDPPAVEPESVEPMVPPAPTAAETVRDLVAGGFRLPIGVARQVRELLADPMAIPAASSATVGTIRGLVAQLSDVEKAHSPLWTERSLRRRLEVVRAPFRATKSAATRLGGTLNTAFLTAAAEAAARYHRELGAPVEQLRASMAVSTRTAQSGANAFTLARINVPTGDMPIADRFRAIQAIADEARGDGTMALTRRALRGRRCAPDVAGHAHRPAAVADARLRHVERPRLARRRSTSAVPSCCRTTRSARCWARRST